MSCLLDRMPQRASDDPILVGTGRIVTSADLGGRGGVEDISADARVALCIRDSVRLIELLAALDGQVQTMLLLSYALDADVVATLQRQHDCPVLLTDREDLPGGRKPEAAISTQRRPDPVATDWLMTTSGTTGTPKVVRHSLASLSRTVYRFDPAATPVWGMLYDPTRYAGMQVTLQALIGGGTLVVPDTSAPLSDQVTVLAARGVTHLSATPTLWRRLLMVPGIGALTLKQITLGGETVDQDIIDALRTRFPAARVSHIYASTEAGVGFSVTDGKAGFPESYLTNAPAGVRMKVTEGVLWLCPPVRPSASGSAVISDADGFICSADMVEIRDGRVYFLGRESGVINVGGVKVYPEVVERVVAQVPGVRLVRVTSKKSPITGALVIAEVHADDKADRQALKTAITEACKVDLPREAVPAMIRFVSDFELNAAGKLVRRSAEGT